MNLSDLSSLGQTRVSPAVDLAAAASGKALEAVRDMSGGQTPLVGSTEAAWPLQQTFEQLMSELAMAQSQSREQAIGLSTGKTESLQDVVLAAAKADLAFQFMLELRNRIIATYQDVMRMQV